VTPDDIAIANRLAGVVLGRSVDELPPQTRALWNGLQAFVAAEATRQGVTPDRIAFDRRGAAAALGWSYKQVRQHLDRLVAEDFVVVVASGLGQVLRYRLVDGLDAAGRLDLRLGSHASTGTPTPTMPTLPTETGVCPYPAQADRAGSNDGATRADVASDGGSAHAPLAHVGGYHQPASDTSQAQAVA
jgi:hypothetical protein